MWFVRFHLSLTAISLVVISDSVKHKSALKITTTKIIKQ